MSQRFDFESLPIADLYKIHRKLISDHRGFLARIFCANEFREIGLSKPIVQMNHTLTKNAGAVRGMHYQNPPFTETKIITCVKGEVFDVAIDLRKDSKTFLHWHAEILSEENHASLYIPDGFAHGFQTLKDNCELLYLHTNIYEQEAEGALNANDPYLSIEWPLKITDISERDKHHSMVSKEFTGLELK